MIEKRDLQGVAKVHSDRCWDESTTDVIFLLQWRDRQLVQDVPGCEYDGESWRKEGEEDGEPLTNGELDSILEDNGECHVDIWRTEGVWLDRKEAEAFGEYNAHNYPCRKKNVGWRVYGVCSWGQLAELLKHQDQVKVKHDQHDQRTTRPGGSSGKTTL